MSSEFRGLNSNIKHLLISALYTEKYGFSVVLAIKVICPFSI